jgi:hypothetical protein
MQKTIIILINILVVLVSCVTNINDNKVKNDSSVSQKEVAMMEPLLSREEFIEFINENQHLDNVNITEDDLEGIDIEDFIKSSSMNKDSIKRYGLMQAIERYQEELKWRILEPFVAYDLKSVESTDEEFIKFKKRFFEEVDIRSEYLLTDDFMIDRFYIYYKGRNQSVLIGQTKNLEKANITKQDNVYCVTYILDASGYTHWAPIQYSKNSKYFILKIEYNDFEYQLLKIFCEIDD